MTTPAGRMAGQHAAAYVPGPSFRARMALQVDAAMVAASVAVAKPDYGVELAERAAKAARAAVLALIDNDNPDSAGMHLPIVHGISQQAYAIEWNRLLAKPREEWE